MTHPSQSKLAPYLVLYAPLHLTLSTPALQYKINDTETMTGTDGIDSNSDQDTDTVSKPSDVIMYGTVRVGKTIYQLWMNWCNRIF